MLNLRSAKSFLRKTILIGWALAVVWIYMGNLVNFHQHKIWGKQLIPVACSSTRIKEKEAASFVKHDRSSKVFDSAQHFDFTTPGHWVSDIPHFETGTSCFILPDIQVLRQGIQAFSFRGPPSA